MFRSTRQYLTGQLQTLLSSRSPERSKRKTLASKGRKMILESLETRRVFDAGWASTMDNTFTSAMDNDSSGNQYITGQLVPSNNITVTLENTSFVNTNYNMFVAKQGSNGQFLWTAFAGNSISNAASSRAIAADNNGNLFIAGIFQGNATFGTETLTSYGDSDAFVAKLNATTGQFLWARRFGGTGKDIARGIEVDFNGNIVVTGGLGLAPSASSDAPILFASKIDTNGQTLWSRELSGDANMTGSIIGPTFDSTGAVYLGGRFQGTLQLPTGSLTSVASISGAGLPIADGFVTKLDADGNTVWGRSLPGDSSKYVTGLHTGLNGQVYVAGTFFGTSDFDGVQLVSAGNRDGFLSSLDSHTGAIVWAHRVGGNDLDQINDIDVSPQGDIYATGVFESSANFGSQTLTSDGKTNAFVAKVSSSGQFLGTNRFITGQTLASPTINSTLLIKGIRVDSMGALFVLGNSWWGGSTTWTGVQAPQKPITPRLSSLTYNFDFVVKLPPIAPTKFYVVDDSNRDRTYQYGSNGELTVDNFSIHSGNTSPRGAASNATGTTVWVGDRNKNVYVYKNDGGLQGSWSAGSLPSVASVEGVTTNGTDVWIVDNASDRVYRYTGAASRVSGSQVAASNFKLNSANSNPKGIVTDGTHIWVLNDSTTDKIFKYTVSGTFLGSWNIDSTNKSPTGLTIDPTNGSQSIWVVDNGTDKIYEYANARARTSGSQTASKAYRLAVGNTNPQGIADPPPPSMDLASKGTGLAPSTSTASDTTLEVTEWNHTSRFTFPIATEWSRDQSSNVRQQVPIHDADKIFTTWGRDIHLAPAIQKTGSDLSSLSLSNPRPNLQAESTIQESKDGEWIELLVADLLN